MVPARLNRRERVDPAIGYLLCGVIDLGYVTPGVKPVATVCYVIDLGYVVASGLIARLTLALISKRGHALYAEAVDHEDFAGVGFFEFTVNPGGDEQAIEVRPAKGTGSGFEAR